MGSSNTGSAFEVHNFVSCQRTALGGFLDTVVDGLDVFLGDAAADGCVDEFVALACFLRLEANFTVTVLTFTAGLTHVLTFGFHTLADGFAVGYLRLTDVGFHLELTQQSVDDDFEVQLAHTGNNGLPGFLVGVSLECGVFLGEFDEREGHLFLSCLGLGLDCYLNNGFGENHAFQLDGVVFHTQSVTRGSILQTDQCNDFACVGFGDFLTLSGVHLQYLGYAFALALGAVVHVATCLQRTAVYAAVAQFAHKRVGDNLECKSAERLVVVRLAYDLLVVILDVETDNVVHVYGAGTSSF